MMARFLFVTALTMALATTLASTATPNEEEEHFTTAPSFHELHSSEDGYSGTGHHHPGRGMTCDEYPRVCRGPGSRGPDCCGKKCVNVDTDEFNCGRCRCRCRYGQACCSGRCTNVMFDPRNCGACGHKCKKGCSCKHGMCNYA